mgnify:CR=1 FL=1
MLIPENNPCKPMNAKAIRAAVIKAIGRPLNALGTLLVSSLTLIAQKTTIMSKNPMDVPKPFAKAFKKVSP